MKLKIYLLIGLILIPSCLVVCQEPLWLKKITSVELLKANREDIIKLFGQPENSTYPYFKSFNLEDGKMEVEYSTGFCGSNKKKGWNVSEFTVTRIFFELKKPLNPKMMGIDTTGFRKYPVSDVPNAYEYENEETGINYFVTSKGKVESFEFYPSNKYDNLYCKEVFLP